jgi:hypothetical protein
MDAHEPLPYVAIGCVLIPNLERALAEGELAHIVKICAYLEDVAVSSCSDKMLETLLHIELETLLHIEIGEWIGYAAHEDRLAPWLGPETKRISGYVPGLATQRRQLKEEKARKSLSNRLRRLLQKS